jgi:hypothetical protein
MYRCDTAVVRKRAIAANGPVINGEMMIQKQQLPQL